MAFSLLKSELCLFKNIRESKVDYLPDSSSSALDHIPDCDAIVGERRKQDLDGHLRLVNAEEGNPGNNPNRMGMSRRVIIFTTFFTL